MRRFTCGFIFTILLSAFVLQSKAIFHHSSETKIPSIDQHQANQWLSSGRSIPVRWRHQQVSRPSDDVDQTLRQLQFVNDNGIRQFDTQSFEGVPMEVIYEMVSRKQNRRA